MSLKYRSDCYFFFGECHCAQLQPGETVVLENGEYVLYAVWFPAPAKIKYTLDYQAGFFSSPKDTVVSTMDSQATLIVTDEIPSKRGSRFLGWSTVKNGSVEYVPGDEITLTSEQPVLKLYPVWEKAPQMTSYRLDYRAGLFTSPRDTVVKSGEDHAVLVVTEKIPRGRGTFLGWSTEKNGPVQYQAGDQITLYADSPTLRLYPVRVK